MNKALLEARLNELHEQEQKAWGDLNYVQGCQAECLLWYNQMAQEEAAETLPPSEPMTLEQMDQEYPFPGPVTMTVDEDVDVGDGLIATQRTITTYGSEYEGAEVTKDELFDLAYALQEGTNGSTPIPD